MAPSSEPVRNELVSCDSCCSHSLERPIFWCDICDRDLCGPCYDDHPCMCDGDDEWDEDEPVWIDGE